MARGEESIHAHLCSQLPCCSVTTDQPGLVASSDPASHTEAFGLATVGKAKGGYLEFFDLELDRLDVGAELQVLEPLQLFLRLAQPGPDVVQVRVELLPLLQVLFHSQLLAQGLSLKELPSVNHTWPEVTNTEQGAVFLHAEYLGNALYTGG